MYARSKLLIFSAFALVGGAILTTHPVRAEADDEVIIKVVSKVDVRAQIKFYSQDRPHVWPGASTAWNLDDFATHSYKLACISGEKICFGAWSVTRDGHKGSLIWGISSGACRRCCFICGEGPYETQELIY
jgi:hypothetical protein